MPAVRELHILGGGIAAADRIAGGWRVLAVVGPFGVGWAKAELGGGPLMEPFARARARTRARGVRYERSMTVGCSARRTIGACGASGPLAGRRGDGQG